MKLRDLKPGTPHRCTSHSDVPTILIAADDTRPLFKKVHHDNEWSFIREGSSAWSNHLDHEVEILEHWTTHPVPTRKQLRLRDIPHVGGTCFRYLGDDHGPDVAKTYGSHHRNPIVMLETTSGVQLPRDWFWASLTTKNYYQSHANCPVELLHHFSTHPEPTPLDASAVTAHQRLLETEVEGVKMKDLWEAFVAARQKERMPSMSETQLDAVQKAYARWYTEELRRRVRASDEERQRRERYQVVVDIQDID